MDEEKGERDSGPIFKDIRRYFCDHCGICRSKKSLITSHILIHHPEKVDNGGKEEEEISSLNECQECGATFRKPAHLKQHLQSHSLERPFVCSVDDCHASYRRKDHLNRHHLQHQGKLFSCTIQNCNKEFAFQGNMKRHVKEFHAEDSPSPDAGSQKQYICQEVGCGKVFKFASKLRKHEDSHVKVDSVEAFCSEPSCMKYFTNEQCLKAHVQSCHQYVNCQICGAKQLKKNIKRHLQSHESGVASERIKCDFEGCLHTFSTKSNMRQHVKAVHEELKPFACSFSGCGMRFAFKHVRDNHENSARHVYVPGDFIESDDQFRSRPRGGRKRTCPTLEMLIRKRVTPPEIARNGYNDGPRA
ncbi:transcription factor IIIA [Hibiscus trionum]|uniref:Transcription factor IIIA n=1 Tax=Hibiscus trionum TaxID=183268 RepID=A0A9W7ICH6_HIBTR|nr:transcription factor IIIA [Hibiscus trionum]